MWFNKKSAKKSSYNLIMVIQDANHDRSLKNISRRMHKLTEENGELAEAYLYVTTINSKKDKTWTDFREEAVDAAIVALDIALTELPIDGGKTAEQIVTSVEEMFKLKLRKWADQQSSGQDATQRKKE